MGKEFDALLIDTDCDNSPFDLLDTQTETEMVQKFLYCGDDRNIAQVFVAGRRVKNQYLDPAVGKISGSISHCSPM